MTNKMCVERYTQELTAFLYMGYLSKDLLRYGEEMTRDDIIELANKAADQAPREDWNTNVWVFGGEMLEYFAALVAAAERSACAQVCESMRPSKAEFDQRYYAGCTDSAAAIRAMGEK